jgi:hypothetical protein
MKVGELIAALSTCDPNTPVIIEICTLPYQFKEVETALPWNAKDSRYRAGYLELNVTGKYSVVVLKLYEYGHKYYHCLLSL